MNWGKNLKVGRNLMSQTAQAACGRTPPPTHTHTNANDRRDFKRNSTLEALRDRVGNHSLPPPNTNCEAKCKL